MLPHTNGTGKNVRISVDLLISALLFTAIVEFFVAFYFRGFQRASVILHAGLFMGFSMAAFSWAVFEIMKRIPGFLEKRPPVYLIIFPASVLIFGMITEKFIFRMGGVHNFWIIGGLGVSLFLSLALDAHDRIRYLITDSIVRLEKLYRQVILSLNKSLEVKEPYNKGHNERVAWYSRAICQSMGFDGERCGHVARAAVLHDLGKIGISEKILLKEGTLEESEWELIRSHPMITERILRPVTGFSREIGIIRFHHEHLDGSGYGSLAGEEIPIESRIITVADAFDAMTTDRPYRPARSIDEAINELNGRRGSQFDPDVVDAFIRFLKSHDNFEKPDYVSVRREMAVEEMGQPFEAGMEEDFIEILRGTARKLTLMEKFYRMMGMKEKYLHRRIFNALGSGAVIGLFIGFCVYSISGDPRQVLSFFLQGVAGGSGVLLVGVSLENLFLRYSRNVLWRKPLGRALIFFPAGVVAGMLALHMVYFSFSPASPRLPDPWNVSYILFAGLIASSVAYLTDFLQKISALLLINLRNLEKLYFQLIYSLAFALEAKDFYTRGHSERVAEYSRLVGKRMGLKSQELEELKLAALFHDVGKIGVRLSILHKNEKLDEGEFNHIKKHPSVGAEIISSISSFSKLAPYVRHHHEWWNGKGYPDGLKQEEIPLFSRIISVADAFDALVTERSYKKGMTKEEAIAILKEESGEKFDPHVVAQLIQAVSGLNLARVQEAVAYPEVSHVS
jgi:HD-GYP domain-containing protein (c-di-GMP phosphodiesterase class II)